MNTLSSLLNWIGSTIGANPSTLRTTSKTLVGAINEVANNVYPVGCYFWTSDGSFDPAATFGGTWEKMNEGMVLVSAGTNYPISVGVAKDGGSATHMLTVNEMPSHTHKLPAAVFRYIDKTSNFQSGNSRKCFSEDNNLTTNATGGSQAFSIMQPYKNAYCWHRVA